MNSRTVSVLIGLAVLIAGVYVALEVVEALGFVLIAVGVIVVAARFLRR